MIALVDNYRFLAGYNRWFNERLYAAAEQLPWQERARERGAFFGSIHGTLNHLVWADQVWLQRFAQQGVAFAALDEDLLQLPPQASFGAMLHPDWDSLKAQRGRLDAAIEAWVHEMSADFPLRTMRYTNRSGAQREHPAWQALTHLFNHQAHHRGQVTTLLMQSGIDPGVSDLIARV